MFEMFRTCLVFQTRLISVFKQTIVRKRVKAIEMTAFTEDFEFGYETVGKLIKRVNKMEPISVSETWTCDNGENVTFHTSAVAVKKKT